MERLERKDTESFEEAYGNWRGSPSAWVDGYPNVSAHAIIAEAILDENPSEGCPDTRKSDPNCWTTPLGSTRRTTNYRLTHEEIQWVTSVSF